MILKQIKLNVKVDSESYILTKNCEVVKVLNIVKCKNNKIIIIGKQFEKKTAFYEKPINSSFLDIYIVHNLSEELKYWDEFELKKKMMVIIKENISVAMPIMHTEV